MATKSTGKRSVPQRSLPVPIIAQDPSVTDAQGVVLGEAEVTNESCAPGPRGARVHVVDYDSSGNRFYEPTLLPKFGGEPELKEYAKRLADPVELGKRRDLHCVNAYATVMHVLGRFEYALGRRVAWGFGDYGGHQISVVPHAFADANAYYSEENRALLFGYFPDLNQPKKPLVYACLSHDIVAHESSHALLDGLRTRYTDPSSPDQAAFHEAFADLVALLSLFTMPKVVTSLLEPSGRGVNRKRSEKTLVAPADFDGVWLQESPLLAMAEQFGGALGSLPHRAALRVSLLLEPDRTLYANMEEFAEPHRRAEILVAATLRALIMMWKRALWGHLLEPERPIPLDVVVTEGCELAERLLSMVIRAIDYAPVVDIRFSDFLAALLTADRELYPRDDKYKARDAFLTNFAAYGIQSISTADHCWEPAQDLQLRYDHVHPDVLKHDPNEVFRFLWENRQALNIDEQAYTRVLSVRPCLRKGPDGFYLHETVCEYVQLLKLRASELRTVRLDPRAPSKRSERLVRPDGLSDDAEVTLNGGGVLLFDEYGRLKFHIQSRVRSWRQSERLESLAAAGALLTSSAQRRHFAMLHRGGTTRWAGLRSSVSMRTAHNHRHDIETETW
ncbi:MAG: hypothetical protein ABW061_08140 [Polyangiaceae bacterium]